MRKHACEWAFDRYERGEISLGTLAEQADLPLRRAMGELRDRGTHFRYFEESLDEDLPDSEAGTVVADATVL